MYQFKSRVRYSETGVDARLSLMGIMNYMQDCSTFQSEDCGVGLAYLEESCVASVILADPDLKETGSGRGDHRLHLAL